MKHLTGRVVSRQPTQPTSGHNGLAWIRLTWIDCSVKTALATVHSQLTRSKRTTQRGLLACGSLHAGRVALFRDLHGCVSKEQRDLIDGNAGEQHLDRECIAEHVRVATLASA